MADEKEKGTCVYCGAGTTGKDIYGNFKCSTCYPEDSEKEGEQK